MTPGPFPLALLLMAAGLLFLPLRAPAQPPAKVARVGYMAPPAGPIHVEQAFLQGLREHGWIEGRNMTIEWRFAAGQDDRFAGFATDLIRQGADVIVTGGNAATRAAQEATATIPIVMVGVGNAVEAGFVASLARPGGNITGMSLAGLNSKRLELLKEAVPKASRIALLRTSDRLSDQAVRVTQEAARVLRVRLFVYEVESRADLDGAFAAMAKDSVEALLTQGAPMFLVERSRIAALALKYRLPTIGHTKEFVDAGGLLGFGADVPESARRAAFYVDRILKGTPPGNLPVEEPTKFELAVNLGTAKTLGLAIPPSILLRAQHVVGP
jgi:putative tryptophan/tyrosine transport system substrate-binding protein